MLDASAGVEAALGTPAGAEVAVLMRERAPVAVPAHFDAECYTAFARMRRHGVLAPSALVAAVGWLMRAPADRVPLERLLPGVLMWVDRTSGADAFYAELAEQLDAALVTCDGPLSRAVPRAILVKRG